jgi:hypothetical protein
VDLETDKECEEGQGEKKDVCSQTEKEIETERKTKREKE